MITIEVDEICRKLSAYPSEEVIRYETIEFANCDWMVKTSQEPVGSGPNYFSNSEENVWVDSADRLHLSTCPANPTFSPTGREG